MKDSKEVFLTRNKIGNIRNFNICVNSFTSSSLYGLH